MQSSQSIHIPLDQHAPCIKAKMNMSQSQTNLTLSTVSKHYKDETFAVQGVDCHTLYLTCTFKGMQLGVKVNDLKSSTKNICDWVISQERAVRGDIS